jgi:hypothetical protein
VYTLHVSILEFPSTWRVHFAFSRVEDNGTVRPFGTREVWIEREAEDVDPLTEALRVVKRAATLELRPHR